MKLRMTRAELIAGDIAVHGEVAYPMEELDAGPTSARYPGEPVPAHHHHVLVSSDGKVLVTSGGRPPQTEDLEAKPADLE